MLGLQLSKKKKIIFFVVLSLCLGYAVEVFQPFKVFKESMFVAIGKAKIASQNHEITELVETSKSSNKVSFREGDPYPQFPRYKVKPGEIVTEIAKKKKVSKESIKEFNNLDDDYSIKSGQILIIPTAYIARR